MAMNNLEGRLFSDIVRLVNRTNVPLEFMYDSIAYVVPAYNSNKGKKGLVVPRFIAMHAIQKFPLVQEQFTGEVESSLLGIEDDEKFPTDPIKDFDYKKWKDGDKIQLPEQEMIEGKVAKRTVLNLVPQKESFVGNNT